VTSEHFFYIFNASFFFPACLIFLWGEQESKRIWDFLNYKTYCVKPWISKPFFFFWQRTTPFIVDSLCRLTWKNNRSGAPKLVSYCLMFIVYAKFTNMAVGLIIRQNKYIYFTTCEYCTFIGFGICLSRETVALGLKDCWPISIYLCAYKHDGGLG
jgi:hypothetical protein